MPNEREPADERGSQLGGGELRKPALRRSDVVVDPTLLFLLDRIYWLKQFRQRQPVIHFRLRTLLIVVSVLCVGLALIVAPLLRHKRTHAREIELLRPLSDLPLSHRVTWERRSDWPLDSAMLIGSRPEIFDRVFSIALEEENWRSVRQPDGSYKSFPRPHKLPEGLFNRFPDLEYLEIISLQNCVLTHQEFEDFAQSSVQVLELGSCSLARHQVKCSGQFRHLNKLYLSSCDLGDGTFFSHLRESPGLTVISLRYCDLPPECWEPLAGISSLQQLELCEVTVTEQGLRSLAALPQLRKLDLVGTDMDPADLAIVAIFPALETVRIGADVVTVEAANALAKSGTELKLDIPNQHQMNPRAEKILRDYRILVR